jgi:hypothetical protein
MKKPCFRRFVDVPLGERIRVLVSEEGTCRREKIRTNNFEQITIREMTQSI